VSRAVAVADRIPLDAYFTPDPLAVALVSLLDIRNGDMVIEPSCGGGAFVRAIHAAAPSAHVLGIDINPDAPGLVAADSSMVGDWPALAPSLEVATWVVGNPPYGAAASHIAAALDAGLNVAMLLRLAMLEGGARFAWWRECAAPRLHTVYALAERPSFTGGGTDSAAYGWFVWGPEPVAGGPRLRWLSWRDGVRVLP
jgi:predicted RNA methylase